jgi:hypothetical protein
MNIEIIQSDASGFCDVTTGECVVADASEADAESHGPAKLNAQHPEVSDADAHAS